jgi:hypothetical protein
MKRQRLAIAPLDELQLRLDSPFGQEPLGVAGDGALVRLPDGTLGVVATFGQAGSRIRVLTESGAVQVAADQLVQVLTSPVLAAKLLIHLAQTITDLEHPDHP